MTKMIRTTITTKIVIMKAMIKRIPMQTSKVATQKVEKVKTMVRMMI